MLSVVPYLFGGYRTANLGSYFSYYNLPEVDIYLGILPLVALVALFHPRWPSRLPGRERLTWYLVGLLGLLLALGGSTPLEHLFNAVPLYGHQRLQSRNMITVCTAVCVLFAGWIDRDAAPAPVAPIAAAFRLVDGAWCRWALCRRLALWALVGRPMGW